MPDLEKAVFILEAAVRDLKHTVGDLDQIARDLSDNIEEVDDGDTASEDTVYPSLLILLADVRTTGRALLLAHYEQESAHHSSDLSPAALEAVRREEAEAVQRAVRDFENVLDRLDKVCS